MLALLALLIIASLRVVNLFDWNMFCPELKEMIYCFISFSGLMAADGIYESKFKK